MYERKSWSAIRRALYRVLLLLQSLQVKVELRRPEAGVADCQWALWSVGASTLLALALMLVQVLQVRSVVELLADSHLGREQGWADICSNAKLSTLTWQRSQWDLSIQNVDLILNEPWSGFVSSFCENSNEPEPNEARTREKLGSAGSWSSRNAALRTYICSIPTESLGNEVGTYGLMPQSALAFAPSTKGTSYWPPRPNLSGYEAISAPRQGTRANMLKKTSKNRCLRAISG